MRYRSAVSGGWVLADDDQCGQRKQAVNKLGDPDHADLDANDPDDDGGDGELGAVVADVAYEYGDDDCGAGALEVADVGAALLGAGVGDVAVVAGADAGDEDGAGVDATLVDFRSLR